MINWWLPLLLTQYVAALNTIVAQGNLLFDAVTNERFYAKGLAYQVRSGKEGIDYDALADFRICSEHIKIFKELGINLIRVYQIDQSKNHDECMNLLEKEKIYVALDLPVPKHSINRDNPSYDYTILDHYKETVNIFDKYENVAFYFAGNEITNSLKNTDASVFVKAALRDIKAYIKTKKHKVLVGYANLDHNDVRKNVNDYFNCGSEDERPDFMGLNSYRWCNHPNYETSSYVSLMEEFKGYNIPVIMSEFGCNDVRPREFVKEIDAIFGPMNSIFSGGIAYEFDPKDKFGLVEMDSNYHVTKKQDVEIKNIKEGYNQNPKSKKFKNDFTFDKMEPRTCPAISNSWKSHETLPHTPNKEACDCMVKKLECIADPKLDYTDTQKIKGLFGYLCGQVDCTSSISSNTQSGKHGLVSGCNTHHKLSWALHANYIKSNRNKEACKENSIIQTPNPDTEYEKCFKHPNSNNALSFNSNQPPFYLYLFSTILIIGTVF